MRNTDSDWELFAQRDPYWAVLTAEEFRRENLDEGNRSAFFRNGEGTIAEAIQVLQRLFGCPDQFDTVLDFGCGVGRLLFPLARRSRIALGVDVSSSMLKECESNGSRFRAENIVLLRSDDTLSQVQAYSGTVELITSMLVLQHIQPSRGLHMLGQLLDLLSPKCAGVIQLIAGSAASESPSGSGPVMEMNSYDLNTVVSILQARGIQDVFCRIADHDGRMGVTMFFHRDIKIARALGQGRIAF